MAQTTQVSGVATNIHTDATGTTHIRYHATDVVSFTPTTVTLRSGGWESATTKRRMNQTSAQFGLQYTVVQRHNRWYVTLPSGDTVPFRDGMVFPRAS